MKAVIIFRQMNLIIKLRGKKEKENRHCFENGRDVRKISMSVSRLGSAQVNIMSYNRQSISYYGYIRQRRNMLIPILPPFTIYHQKTFIIKGRRRLSIIDGQVGNDGR